MAEDITKKAELILHKWKMDLRTKPRTKDYVTANFDELVEKWYRCNVPIETAKELFSNAIKAHFPTQGCARAVFNKIRSTTKMSEREFLDSWNKNIEVQAYQSFYSYYDLDLPPEPVKKQYGQMSEREYKLQRAYADSFESIDPKTIDHSNFASCDVDLEEL